jgi:hypothetical protein
VLALEGHTVHVSYQQQGLSLPLPSYDGRWVYMSGGIFSQELERLSQSGETRCTWFLPSSHPAFYIGLTPQGEFRGGAGSPHVLLSVYSSADHKLLAAFPDINGIANPTSGAAISGLALDRRILYLPTIDLLVTIPETNDALVLHHIDLIGRLKQAGSDYLFVTSVPPAVAARGSSYQYAIDVRSSRGGVSYALSSGPKGMTLSPGGRLTWEVPADFAQPRAPVIVAVKDASGREIFHTFTINVR